MKNSKLVYSTAGDSHCRRCGRHLRACQCEHKQVTTAPVGPVRIGRQSKGRGGKTVTVISGLPLAEPELKALAKELKSLCGTGGTVKDGIVEIQGDHRQAILEKLAPRFANVKIAGG